MSTQRVSCPNQTWTQVTNVSKEGTIVLLSDGVILTESATEPTGDGNDTPRSGNLTQSGAWGSYSKVAAAEFIWAYATTGDADLDVTPADGGDL